MLPQLKNWAHVYKKEPEGQVWKWVTRVKRDDYSRATFFHDSGFNVTATTSGINPNIVVVEWFVR